MTKPRSGNAKSGTITGPDPPKALYALLLVLTTCISFLTRFWKLHWPPEVVFDEVHFGKFASFYLQRKFYFDVHPPLGRMLFAAVGYVVGYDGHYLFDKIGENYHEHVVPFEAFRGWAALCGAALPGVVVVCLRGLGLGLPAMALGAALVLFDNALVAQSRLILLDSMLVLFCLLAHYAWVKFYNHRHRPCSLPWWRWLLLTGVAISLAMGVKMVGWLTAASIGLVTVADLWRLLDIRRGLSWLNFVGHFLARAVALITVPLALYLSFFAIHFGILNHAGTGDWLMSPAFQATLKGNRMSGDAVPLFYGANVTVRHYLTNSFLHSHPYNYPLHHVDGKVSSQGQQVTAYPHRDENNIFQVLPTNRDLWDNIHDPDGDHVPVMEQDAVVFRHVVTNKLLLTHDVASPLTRTNQEFACFPAGHPKRPPSYNTFFIESESQKKASPRNQLVSIGSRFRIAHNDTGVYLKSYKSRLPEWGFNQQEVNGERKKGLKETIWMFEEIRNIQRNRPFPELSSRNKAIDKPSFLSKFVELQSKMISRNSEMKQPHPYMSPPWEWPFVLRGVGFWQNNVDKQIYLIGNPIGWWLTLGLSLFLAGALFIHTVGERRGVQVFDPVVVYRTRRSGGFLALAWVVHYGPFMFMGRSLFLHHYLPPLVFSFMLAAVSFEFFWMAFLPSLFRHPAEAPRATKPVVGTMLKEEARTGTSPAPDGSSHHSESGDEVIKSTGRKEAHMVHRRTKPSPRLRSRSSEKKNFTRPPTVVGRTFGPFKQSLQWCSTVVIISVLIFTFLKFTPLTYGDTPQSYEELRRLKWMDSWEFQFTQKKKVPPPPPAAAPDPAGLSRNGQPAVQASPSAASRSAFDPAM